VINRSMTREIPHFPVAPYEVAHLLGTLVAETILASVHARAHKQAGHMDASDLIKALQNTLQGEGRPHMGNVGLYAIIRKTRSFSLILSTGASNAPIDWSCSHALHRSGRRCARTEPWSRRCSIRRCRFR